MFNPVTDFTARRPFPEWKDFKAEGYIFEDVKTPEQCIMLKNKTNILFSRRKVCGVLVFQNDFS